MATNPYTNKVEYNGDTLIDISDTTATSDKVQTGYKIYGADGSPIYGTATQGQGVTITDTTDPVAGGTFRDITAQLIAPYSPYGQNMELIETIVRDSVPLTSTTYDANKAATSAKSIYTAQTVKTYTLDLDNYEYMSEWLVSVKYIFPSGTTMAKGYPYIYSSVRTGYFSKRPTTVALLRSNTFSTKSFLSLTALHMTVSYSSASALYDPTLTNYGIYTYSNSSTISGNTATIKTPPIYVGSANATYFASACRELIDQANTVIKMTHRLYRGAISTGYLTPLFHDLVDTWRAEEA